jgi:hypothetical protein
LTRAAIRLYDFAIGFRELAFRRATFVQPLEQFSSLWLMLEEVRIVEIERFHGLRFRSKDYLLRRCVHL